MDWQRLNHLRKVFLAAQGQKGVPDYWSDPELLAAYDQTLAQRILWKWQAVWQDLGSRGWSPGFEIKTIGDWGCGTGIATRSFLNSSFFSLLKSSPEFFLMDRSKIATGFAAKAVADQLSDAKVTVSTHSMPAVDLLLVSHVSNELDTDSRAALIRALKLAQMVVIVEPGTTEASRFLVELREILQKQFRIVAPCFNQAACPLAKNAKGDWCHQFAKAPAEVFHDAFWSEFSRTLKVDLKSVPLSYLIATRQVLASNEDFAVVKIGASRRLKHGEEVLVCSAEGTLKKMDLKRLNPIRESFWSAYRHE